VCLRVYRPLVDLFVRHVNDDLQMMQLVVDQNSHTHIHSLIFTAFPSAPILSADEGFLYLAGASASILCVSTVDGSNEWSFVTDGLHAAQPVLSEIEGEDPVLYTIEVRMFDARTRKFTCGIRF
jgi:hypothetical protein